MAIPLWTDEMVVTLRRKWQAGETDPRKVAKEHHTTVQVASDMLHARSYKHVGEFTKNELREMAAWVKEGDNHGA